MAPGYVIERGDFDALFAALARARLHGRRTDGARRRDRLRRDPPARRPADRLDRRAGRRPLPAAPPRRRGAVRLRRRPALVEALPAAGRGDAVAGARRRATAALAERRRAAARRRRATRSSARARASCTRWGSSTACCSAARIPTRPIAPGARTCSSSPSSAAQAGGTCFCVVDEHRPGRPSAGFDLALTEVLDDGRHYFVVEVGSERGAEVLADVPHRAARRRRARRRARAVHARTAVADGPRARHDRTSRSCCTATTSTRAGTRSPSAA